MDTRTPKKELADLAFIAGKLGENTLEGVQQFVKGADLINVALKEDLGGSAEEAINKIAKLIQVFGLKEEFGIKESFNKVGSVINAVGAASTANEEYLVEFTTRLAGIAPAAKISITQVIGLASTMDQLGQRNEIAATNIGKMLVAIGKDIPYFAKVAGVSVGQFTKMLKEDANEAFLQVVERAGRTEKGLAGLATTFKTLGIDGSEGAAVIGSLAKNIDLVRHEQALANDEFNKGTSLIAEYNIKNNNTAAIWEKVSKKIDSAFSTMSKGTEPLIRLMGRLTGVVSGADLKLQEFAEKQQDLAASEKSLKPLLDRYAALAANLNRNSEEEKTMNELLQKIVAIVPEAATGFDKYGKALGLSSAAAQDFIAKQRGVLEALRLTTKGKVSEELGEMTRKRNELVKQLQSGEFTTSSTSGLGTTSSSTRKMNNDQLKNLSRQISKLNEEIGITKKSFLSLDGIEDLDTRRARRNGKSAQKEIPKGITADGSFAGDGPGGKSKGEAKKKDVDIYKAFEQELKQLRQESLLDTMSKADKEAQTIRFKYDRLREMAHGHKGRIEQANAQELRDLVDFYTREHNISEAAAQQKATEDRRKSDETAARKNEERQRILTEMDNFTQNEEQKQISTLNNQFDRIIADAERIGLDTLPLWEAYWAARGNLEEDYLNKSNQKSDADLKKKQQQTAQLVSGIGNVIGSALELMASNETEFSEFKKAAALAQIAADTASAISSMVAKGAATSLTPIDAALKIVGGIAVVMANIVKAKQVLSQDNAPQKPNIQRIPGRAVGGLTDYASLYQDNSGNPEGFVNVPTLYNLGRRSYVAGEAGREYVLSNKMLQNPVIANFAAMTESLRVGGHNFANQPVGATAQAGGQDNSQMAAMMQTLIYETRQHTAAVQNFANKPYNYRKIEQTQEMLSYIKKQVDA
jgi:TP901 family phage tail tape measure protein